jgi:HEAT repeat protein
MTYPLKSTDDSVDSVPQLIAALKNKELPYHDAVTIANRLARLEKAVDPLIAFLKDEKHPNRLQVAMALTAIGDSRAFESLICFLSEIRDNPHEIFEVNHMLARIPDPRVIDPLLRFLRSDNSSISADASLKLNFFKGIGNGRVYLVSEVCVPPLIIALTDNKKIVRETAAEILIGLQDERVVEPLIAALKDPECKVRQFAAQALGLLKDLRAVGPLIDVLRGESKTGDAAARVRSSAIRSLNNLGDPRAIIPILENYPVAFDETEQVECAYALKSLVPGHEMGFSDFNLKQISEINDAIRRYHDGYRYTAERVNLEDIRQSARQELIRRGM